MENNPDIVRIGMVARAGHPIEQIKRNLLAEEQIGRLKILEMNEETAVVQYLGKYAELMAPDHEDAQP